MDKTIRNENEVINYVEVNKEPIHKELFKNQYVRLYLATIRPGERTLYHRHSEDTVYIVVQGGSIGNQIVGNSKRYPMDFPKSFGIFGKIRLGASNLLLGSVRMPKGFFFCMLHKKQPVIHRATASNDNLRDIIMMGIEIIKKSNHNNQLSLSKDFYKHDYEADTFSIYRLKLRHGQSTGYHTYDLPVLAIALKGTSCISIEGANPSAPRNSKLACGEFQWHDCKTTFHISNMGDGSFEAVIIALK